MSKGINAWAKELKHNENFAKKYLGVKTVQDIINMAKRQGYDINAKELKELDLDAVAGGIGGHNLDVSLEVATKLASISQTAVATGKGSNASTNGDATITQLED